MCSDSSTKEPQYQRLGADVRVDLSVLWRMYAEGISWELDRFVILFPLDASVLPELVCVSVSLYIVLRRRYFRSESGEHFRIYLDGSIIVSIFLVE